MDGAQYIGSLSGGGSLGGNVSLLNYVSFGGNNATTTFAGVISGSGNLVKSGNGTMLLTGSNTYSLGTVLAGGTLAVGSRHNLGGGGAYNALFFNGGTLRVLGSFNTSRQLFVDPGGGTIDATGNALTFSGGLPITWTGNLSLSGGTITFDNLNAGQVSPGSSLTIQSGAIFSITGTATPFSTGGNYVNLVNDSSLAFNLSGETQQVGTLDGVGSTTVSASSPIIATHIRQNSVTLNADATIPQNGTPAGTSNIKTLVISSQAKLNLYNNNLITQSDVGTWNGSAYTGVTGLVQTGRHGGDWNGKGITTWMTQALAPSALTTLAVAANSVLGKTNFGGQSVGAADVLVMYTYDGDADLNGVINGDDYFRIDSGYASHATGYVNGDFNYDGRIDADDYFIIDRNYARQTTPFAQADTLDAASGVIAVPEPAGIAMLGLVAMIGGRRRRHC